MPQPAPGARRAPKWAVTDFGMHRFVIDDQDIPMLGADYLRYFSPECVSLLFSSRLFTSRLVSSLFSPSSFCLLLCHGLFGFFALS